MKSFGAAGLALALSLVIPAAAGNTAGRSVAPGFRVRSVDGQALELARLLQRGPVLLDFWATWCKPCLQSIPEIDSIHRRFGPRGLTVIGVSIDGPRNYSKVRPFAVRLGIGYPVVLDEDGRIQESYAVRLVPTAILVDRDGTIALVHQGYRPGEGALIEDAVAKLLGGSAPAADSALGGVADTLNMPGPR